MKCQRTLKSKNWICTFHSQPSMKRPYPPIHIALNHHIEITLTAGFIQVFTAWKLSVFGVILVRIFWHFRISPYSVRMRENADQNNSEYGHFLRSVSHCRQEHRYNYLTLLGRLCHTPCLHGSTHLAFT